MSDAPLIVGIDAGTTRVRAIVFEPDGKVVARGAAAARVENPMPGWAEYDAEDWWRATVTAIQQTLTQIDSPDAIASVAVASVGEAGVPLDASGRPTYAAIAWFDQRAKDEAAWLETNIGRESLFTKTGLDLDVLFGLCKILWLKRHAPDAYGRTTRWLNFADYVAWRLSGEMATDFSLASRTLVLDIEARQWSRSLLDAVGIDASLFAPLARNGQSLGRIDAAAAAETGLPSHTIVGVGGHDQIVGALAVGGWERGLLIDSIGTAEAILLTTDRPILDETLVARGFSQGAMAIDADQNYVMGGLTTCGACVEWYRDLIGAKDAARVDLDTLAREAEGVPAGALGAGFVPQMRVGSPPNKQPVARGVFFGLTPEHDRGALYRALLEGIAYDGSNIVKHLDAFAAVPEIDRCLSIGGGTKNELLMRLKATLIDYPLDVATMAEATSLGAAVLGALAAGVYDSRQHALSTLAIPLKRVRPFDDERDHYRAGLDRYNDVLRIVQDLHRIGTVRPADRRRPKSKT